MIKKVILRSLLIELMLVIFVFHLFPNYPAAANIFLLVATIIASICYGICTYHQLKEEN